MTMEVIITEKKMALQSNKTYEASAEQEELYRSKDVLDLFLLTFNRMKYYRRLPLFIFPVFLILLVIYYVVAKPLYSATEIIGQPQNPMTVSSSAGLLSSTISKSLGGSSDSSDDYFRTLQQMLQSPGLSAELAAHDHFLQQTFPRMWDSAHQRWKPRGMLHKVASAVKSAMGIQVTDHPGIPQLLKHLDQSLSVESIKDASGSSLSALTGRRASFVSVSYIAPTPDAARAQLNTIMHRADETIRQQNLQETNARIRYLKQQLASVTQAEMRNAYIQLLTTQEYQKMAMVADVPFSYTVLSPPFVPNKPVSPMGLGIGLILSIFMTLILWAILAYWGQASEKMAARMRFFARKGASIPE